MEEQIYIIKDDGLTELSESKFGNEDDFQSLLEMYPKLLSGKLIDYENPRKWLLITREAGIPGEKEGKNTWSVDHLFLDQDGIPTLVEVKRSTDTRIRREVVGQMLDYAANSVAYWSIESIQEKYVLYCEKVGIDPTDELNDFLEFKIEENQFWEMVSTNLKAGKIRMLFVADKIPKELVRIIEFMNEQMSPAEVLGIELKYYSNESVRTLVPKIVGKTASSENRKMAGKKTKWSEDDFFSELEKLKGEKARKISEELVRELKSRNLRLWYGAGKRNGSIVPMLDTEEYKNQLFALYTYGKIEIYFQYYQNKPPFDQKKMRIELLKRLNSLGLNFPESKIDQRPGFDIDVLSDKRIYQGFLTIIDWILEKIKEVQTI